MVNNVELKMLIGLVNPKDEFLKLMEGPSVHFMKLRIGNPVSLWVEVIEVSQKKTIRIPDPKVTVGQPFQDLVGDLNIIFVILCCNPESQDICSQLMDDFFGCDHIPR
jgi:hypothetical protein